MSTTEERNYVEAARREKRAELEKLGVAPFALRFDRTHTAAEALAAYDDAVGEAGPDTLVVVDHNTVPVEAEATQIPTQIVVSIEELPPGTQILARDLQLPDGSTIDLDPETLIVNITNAPTAEALEAELAEAEAEAGIEPTMAPTAEPTPDEALAESESA